MSKNSRPGFVFISYKREEAERARPLRNALLKKGLEVFWDEDLQNGQAWAEELDRAVRDAACIIVLWSERSASSQWVRHEASQAIAREVYAPCRIELLELESPYDRIQSTDLFGWDGDPEHAGFCNLLERVNYLVPPPTPLPTRLARWLRANLATLVASTIAVLALSILVTIYFEQRAARRDKVYDCSAGRQLRTDLALEMYSAGQSLDDVCLRIADLEGIDLSGAGLNRADLSSADLTDADLSGAELNRADLSGADLTGVDLSGAELNRADLSGAVLTSADLSGAELNRADLSGAVLVDADLSEAELDDADLARVMANDSDLPVNLEGASLRRAKLNRAVLVYPNLRNANLEGADLSQATLARPNLQGARLTDANLAKAVLPTADLRGLDLRRSTLSGANLVGARLNEAILSSANLSEARLISADLTDAKLVKAVLVGAHLWKAKFTHADVTGAKLREVQPDARVDAPSQATYLAGACANDLPIGWPLEHFEPPPPCPPPVTDP